MVLYTSPHLLPLIESSDKIAAATTGDSLREDINQLAQTTNTALTTEGARAEGAAKTYADTQFGGLAPRVTTLEGNIVPLWKASTAYAAGYRVIAPNGDVVSAKVNFTSGAAYLATNWNASTQDGRIAAMEALRALPTTAVTTGTDVDTLRTPGRYLVNSITIATSLLNAPSTRSAVITVEATTSGTISQVWTDVYGTDNAIYKRTTNALTPTPYPFGAWRDLSTPGTTTIASGTDVDTLRTPGRYLVSSNAIAATLLNAPDAQPATVIIEVSPTGLVSQEWKDLYTSGGGTSWYRTISSISTTPYPFGAWRDLNAVPAAVASELEAGLPNEVLRQAFSERRGGIIGTAGKAVAAFRFDHGLNAFPALVNLLRQYEIPASLAVFSKMFTTGTNAEQNTNHSWAQVQDWAMYDGIEDLNHGATHNDAATSAALVAEIVTAKADIQAALPKCVIEGWAVPGVNGTNYSGFNAGALHSQFYDTEAGRLILRHHAFSTGHTPGEARPMDGKIRNGRHQHTLDTAALADGAEALVDRAIEIGAGVCFMIHPILIGQPGYIDIARVEAIMAYVAGKRAAGLLETLTLSGLNMADAGSSYRVNLLRDPLFKTGLTAWSSTAAHSVTTEGGEPVVNFTDTASPLSQSLTLANVGWCKGGVYELTFEVRSPTGGVAQAKVVDAADTLAFSADRQITIPASTEWVTIRKHVTIPATGTATLRNYVGRLSGGAMTIRRVRLQPC